MAHSCHQSERRLRVAVAASVMLREKSQSCRCRVEMWGKCLRNCLKEGPAKKERAPKLLGNPALRRENEAHDLVWTQQKRIREQQPCTGGCRLLQVAREKSKVPGTDSIPGATLWVLVSSHPENMKRRSASLRVSFGHRRSVAM